MLRRRAVRGSLLGVLLLAGEGCYTYSPVSSVPRPGALVAVHLTDRGRAALSDRVGPEMDRLLGSLVSSSDTAVVLAMQESVTLRGMSAKWTGEQLVLSRDLIGSIRLRTFSRGRTIMVAGTGGIAALALVLSGGFGGGTNVVPEVPGPPGGPGNSSKTASSSNSSGSNH